MHSDQNEGNSSSIEFMLKEYDRINELWIDENSQAERRVNFFLSIASATIGAIFLIFQLNQSFHRRTVIEFLSIGCPALYSIWIACFISA